MRRTLFFVAIFLFTLTAQRAGATVTPNDALYDRQGYLRQVRIPEAWSMTTGSAKTVIAIVDSGLDIDHPEFQDAIWTNPDEIPGDGIDNDKNGYVDDIHGWDFVNNIPDPNAKFGGDFSFAGINHGTLIGGIIAARGNNSIGISGISWQGRLMPLRVLNNQGEGNVFAVVQAIDYAIEKRAQIINLSFTSDTESSFLSAAIKRALRAGITVVIAAGNDDTEQHGFDLSQKPVYPACSSFIEGGVIVVGATDTFGKRAQFSPYGSCIDVMAPGTDIFSTHVVKYERVGFDTFYGGGWSGTSLATAMVTGTIALMRAVNPTLTPEEVEALLYVSCDSITMPDSSFAGKLGCGQINAVRAVQAAIEKMKRTNPWRPEVASNLARIALAPSNGGGELKTFDSAGHAQSDTPIRMPYAPFRVPYTMAGAKNGLVVFGAGAGGGPHVRIFTSDGKLFGQFFAYDQRWRIGVNIAVGDVDGDGEEEIIAAPASHAGAHIKIFSFDGTLKRHFFAYPQRVRSGYELAVGDLNNDGKDEIIIARATGVPGGEVSVFSDSGLLTRFTPYPESGIERVSVAVGDVDGDGEEDIVTAPQEGSAPVTIFSSVGGFKRAVFPYGPSFDRGMALAVGDLNNNRRQEIVVVPRAQAPAHVMIMNGNGETVGTFFASDKNARTGFTLEIIPR